MSTGDRTGTQALERGIFLLREIAAADIGGVRLADVVARTGLSRSTAHRLLERLAAEELLHKERDGRYHLGRSIYDLGLLASHRFDVSGFAFKPMCALAEKLGDTIFLTRRVGLDMVCVERVEGENAVKVLTMTIGTRRPIGIGAGSLALLAALDADEAEAIMHLNRARIEAYSGRRMTNTLSHRLQIARRNGYAFAGGTLTTGVAGLGIAIETPLHLPTLSLSVVSREAALTKSYRASVLERLRQAAQEISSSLIEGHAVRHQPGGSILRS